MDTRFNLAYLTVIEALEDAARRHRLIVQSQHRELETWHRMCQETWHRMCQETFDQVQQAAERVRKLAME